MGFFIFTLTLLKPMKTSLNEEFLKTYSFNLTELYKNNKKGDKIWNEEKLEQYWNHFSNGIDRANAVINNLTIPKNTNYPLISEIDKITFNNCIFIDDFDFKNTSIKKFSFTSCTFEGYVSFESIEINDINIYDSVFGKSISIKNSSIFNISIKASKVFDSFYIKNCKVLESLKFLSLSIGDNIHIEDSILTGQKKAFFSYINGIKKNAINFEKYYSVKKLIDSYHNFKKNNSQNTFLDIFSITDKSELTNFVFEQKDKLQTDHISLIENIENYFNHLNYLEKPNIYFKDIILESEVIFTRLNLHYFRFENTNIEYMKFIDCNWKINNRLILSEEEYSWMLIENQYRQLKKAFANNQDWKMSGLAYISEMEMHKKRLGYKIDEHKRYISKDSLEYLIYLIYGSLGGYAQNFIRPLTIFLLSTFIFFPILYLFNESTPEGSYNLSLSLKKSIAKAMPLIKFNYKEHHSWYLKAFQTFFSTILLTFIILGLRKRFKQ